MKTNRKLFSVSFLLVRSYGTINYRYLIRTDIHLFNGILYICVIYNIKYEWFMTLHSTIGWKLKHTQKMLSVWVSFFHSVWCMFMAEYVCCYCTVYIEIMLCRAALLSLWWWPINFTLVWSAKREVTVRIPSRTPLRHFFDSMSVSWA